MCKCVYCKVRTKNSFTEIFYCAVAIKILIYMLELGSVHIIEFNISANCFDLLYQVSMKKYTKTECREMNLREKLYQLLLSNRKLT